MIRYIRQYPVSICIILAVIYLSFFKPPQTDIGSIPGMDKVVHVCMYFGLSGMLWLEFIRAHRKTHAPLWHAWIGALLCPVLFSGAIELLQEYCTTYHLPGRRLAGFCRQHHGCPACLACGPVSVDPQVGKRL